MEAQNPLERRRYKLYQQIRGVASSAGGKSKIIFSQVVVFHGDLPFTMIESVENHLKQIQKSHDSQYISPSIIIFTSAF